ncbi:MAG: hypothetical protein R3D33_11570 [Hyphomicrobiaceae bacterium]
MTDTTRQGPLWLPAAPAPGITMLALMTGVEAIGRASIVTLLSLQTYHLFETKQAVTFIGFASPASASSPGSTSRPSSDS